MRDYLCEFATSGQAVIIDVEILRSGNHKFDGNDNLIPPSDVGILCSPFFSIHPKAESFIYTPFLFKTSTTLLRPLGMEGLPKHQFTHKDHFWYPYDLSVYGYCVGEKLQIIGHVAMYRRKDGSVDFCLDPDTVGILRKS